MAVYYLYCSLDSFNRFRVMFSKVFLLFYEFRTFTERIKKGHFLTDWVTQPLQPCVPRRGVFAWVFPLGPPPRWKIVHIVFIDIKRKVNNAPSLA